jgi:hypothetical protein
MTFGNSANYFKKKRKEIVDERQTNRLFSLGAAAQGGHRQAQPGPRHAGEVSSLDGPSLLSRRRRRRGVVLEDGGLFKKGRVAGLGSEPGVGGWAIGRVEGVEEKVDRVTGRVLT